MNASDSPTLAGPPVARGSAAAGAEAADDRSLRGVVLVVTNTLRGGTGAHIVRLLEQLHDDGWRPVLVCHGSRDFDPPAGVPLVDAAVPGGAARRWVDRFPAAQWRQLWQLRRLVREHRPVLVHAFFFWPIMYARILKRLGVIRHLVENREDQGFIWSRNDYRLLRATAGIPDRVVCVSDAVRDVVLEREGTPRERTTVILNGVRLPSGPPAAEEVRAARDELGFGSEHRIVGMVANLDHAVKGAGYFVEGLPSIARRVPDARFLVIGEGRQKTTLESRARELGVGDRVVFTGFRTDVERLYPLMDVSVLTSLSEGLSITILESMSFGIPVVATDVGGNPELVRDGQTGFLVPPRDIGRFADAVVRILCDRALAVELGRQGRAVVERDFALRQVAARYDALYREVIGDGVRGGVT